MPDLRVKIMVYQQDGTIVSQYLLGEGEHAIGRDPNSSIYCESPHVSNDHAKLHLSDEGIFIEDLNSTSGTFLDQINVRGKVRLTPGQRLQVGDLHIDLQLEGVGDLSPGVKIGAGRYQLNKELGRGAMGQVWLAQDTQLDELVAIKVLPSDVANDAVCLLDLKREVQKSRKLSHDNIIRIHDLVQLPGENPFVSLEYVEGTDLHAIQVNQPDRIFSWQEVTPYVMQLCAALDYAHERKIVHRDLKPANIMITHDEVLKLADFGIAASIADATGRSSMADIISGTPQFMSPQQMLGESPRASDDIYALGATMYCLLTGRPPFHTGDIAQQSQHVTPAPLEQRLKEFGLQNEVPDYVNDVVMSCLAKDPTVRPASAGAIGEWLRTGGKSERPAERKATETGVERMVTDKPVATTAEPEAQAQPTQAQPTQAQPTQEQPTVVQAQRDEEKKSPILGIAASFIVVAGLGWFFMGGSGDQGKNQNTGGGTQANSKGAGKGQPENAEKPGTLLWEFKTGGEVFSSPSIGANGTVYFGSYDQYVYALDGKSGAKKWEFKTKGPVRASPAIGPDGTVYIGSRDRKVYALDGKTGAKKWEFETGGEVLSSSAIGSDGTVYFGSEDKKIYALDGVTGIKKWEFETSRAVTPSPAIGSDGTIYFGIGSNREGKVYALDGKTGAKKWEFETGKWMFAPPAIGADGTVYIGAGDKKVYALDGKTAARKWEFITKHEVNTSPAIGADGTIYVGSDDFKVYALDEKNGTKKWEFETKAGIRSSPAIGNDGTVYFGSTNPDNKVYALDGASGAKKWEFETGDRVDSSPTIGTDGTVYVGSRDGKVYALATSSKGLADSPWPMRGQNPQQTSRAPSPLKDGLVAYYPFNGNANDESGNGYDGEVKGSELTADRHGKKASAYEFDENNDSIDLGNRPEFNFGKGDFSLSCWVQQTEANNQHFIGKWNRHVAGYWLGDHQHYTHAGLLDSSGGRPLEAEGGKSLADGGWHQVSAVFDRDANLVVFVDGVPVETRGISEKPGSIDNEESLMIAGNFRGSIDDVRIYNRALSTDEITALYDLEKPKTDLKKGLVAYYPFNGNADDESGNGNDGDVKGATFSNGQAEFNGIDQYIDAKCTSLPQGKSPRTLSFWAKADSPEALGHMVNWGGMVAGKCFGAHVGDSNFAFFGMTKEFDVYRIQSDAAFHHHLVHYDGKEITYYIDAEKKWSENQNQLDTSGESIVIGARPDLTSHFKGIIDDVRIYNRALSAGEITALYDLEKPSSETASSSKKPGTLLWKSASSVWMAPALGHDGTVYVAPIDTRITALDGKTGVEKWVFRTEKWIQSCPAIGTDGTVYIGANENTVYALDGKTGAKKLAFKTEAPMHGTPAIGFDGSIYMGSRDGKIYAFDSKTGNKLWEFQTGGDVYTSPAIGADGTVYVESHDKKIYALNGATGIKKWEFETGSDSGRSSPAIGSDGTVYVGATQNKKVYAMDGKTGAKKWEFLTGDNVRSSPVIGSDGTVYVGSDDKKVYALAGKTGAKKWEFETGGEVAPSAAIGDDGTVYIGSNDKKVYALDGTTGAKKWEFLTGDEIHTSPVIGPDGTLYIGSNDGNTYAFATSSKGPAKSSWPMYGQNAQHTCRASVIPNSPEAAAAIEAAIREAAAKPTGTLTTVDLEKVKNLHLRAVEISDLTVFSGLVELEKLNLDKNNITDLSPLSNLTKLQEIALQYSKISDLRPLAGMKQLKGISLHNNRVTNISPLAGLTKLEVLTLEGNGVTDISHLAGLTKLKLLTLHYTGVSDVSPLEKLTDMEDLIINNNPVSDITPLASMTKLRRLAASSNGFADLTPLAGLKGLDDLDISKNKISNLKPLAGLTNLKALYLADNSITDISSLAELKKLEILDLSNNPAITRAQIAVLQKALPNCKITHNAGPTIGTEIGSIASYDPKFGFYVVDRGSDHGIKNGDEFSVFRAGKFVGKIRIKQVQPTVSIAEAIKDLTPQKLQAGDKVGKMN
jgi:serine/threonine-protein kinase